MAGHDVGRSVSIQIDVSVGARVAAYRRWAMEVKHSQEIRQDIEDWTDKGVLEEDAGPVSSTRCNHVIKQGESFCRRCGAEPGEIDLPNEIDPDEEMLRDENTPVHASEEELEMEIPSEQGSIEKLQDKLLDLGWESGAAEYAAVLLAMTFEDLDKLDGDSYREQLLKTEIAENRSDVVKKLLGEPVQSCIINLLVEQFEGLSRRVNAPKADISIFRGDAGGWRVEVEDLLAGKVAVKLSAGDRDYFELLQKRPRRLRAIGNQLLYHFREKFFEQGIEQANKALSESALVQKEVAQVADLPESTFSRWCNPSEGGVWVTTPHGIYHLGDFFRRTATTGLAGGSSRAGIIGLVLESKRELGDEIPNLGGRLSSDQYKVISDWLKIQSVDMSDRSLRNYWKDAAAVVQVARAMAKLREERLDLTATTIQEEIRLEITDAQFNLYLQLAQFYREQKWDEQLLFG